jgi:hypothetical protein
MFAGGLTQAIRHQGQSAIGQFSSQATLLGQRVDNRLHSQLLPKVPRYQHDSPIPSTHRRRLAVRSLAFFFSLQEAQQGVGMRGQQLLAAQITDDAVARTAGIPIGLDEADIFVDRAVWALDFGGTEEDVVPLSSARDIMKNSR